MAELSANPEAQRACLILEDIPLSALLAFAEDFTVLKTQGRLMAHLPELRRFSVSIVVSRLSPFLLLCAIVSYIFSSHMIFASS
jgi:hypothetical protein